MGNSSKMFAVSLYPVFVFHKKTLFNKTRIALHALPIVSRQGSRVVDGSFRLLSAIPYLIPLTDGLRYAKFFFLQFPVFASLLMPIIPIVQFQDLIPYGSTILLLSVYFGLARNETLSRFVRFNALQACYLDILLNLPSLFESVVGPPHAGPTMQFYIKTYNSVWLFCFICCLYGMGNALLGQWGRLPLVGDSAEIQLGGKE